MKDEKQIEEMARDRFEPRVAIDGIDIAFAAVHGADDAESHFMRIARHLYEKGYRKQTLGEWISVEDRLPEETVSCLVVLDNEDIDIRLFNSKNDPYKTYQFMLNKFLFMDDEGDWYSTDRVTHWMPLPELPKMKGGAE
jgi:hypothetical protein